MLTLTGLFLLAVILTVLVAVGVLVWQIRKIPWSLSVLAPAISDQVLARPAPERGILALRVVEEGIDALRLEQRGHQPSWSLRVQTANGIGGRTRGRVRAPTGAFE